MTGYYYRGDKFTADNLRGQHCVAVRNAAGKCIRGRNGNMLVRFWRDHEVVVVARQLRKETP
jgi:hypothetical protein